ncbi:MAG: cache domain-containing protein [Candidatus Doudnabacteria bacterium]|nr:cache domain-containing protein [Candidatus Doudnabacteria bacterium]
MLNFWLQNLAYALYVITGFGFIAMAWLNLDAYRLHRSKVDFAKAIGFGLVGLGIILRIFANTGDFMFAFSVAVIAMGLLALVIATHKEKILPSKLSDLLPNQIGGNSQSQTLPAVAFSAVLLLPVVNVILSSGLAIQLYRRVSLGKMKEYKALVWVFGLFALAEALFASYFLAGSDVILLQQIFGKYSIAWLVMHLCYVGMVVMTIRWIWRYITFRVKPELFLMFACVSVVVSTLGALLYSGFLFGSTQADLLNQMQKNAGVTSFAVGSLKDNAITAARLLAQNPQIQSALQGKDYRTLFESANLYARELENIDSVIFTDDTAQILVQTDNQSKVGQSLSNDELVVFSLKQNEERTSIKKDTGVLGDEIQVIAVHPVVTAQGAVSGSIKISYVIDDAFVDKLKVQTGMEVALYADDRRAATTLLAPDGLTRRENTLDVNAEVVEKVLKQGQDYAGLVTVINDPYYAAYTPLRNTNNEVIGMIFVGRPQQIVLDAIAASMMNTFLVAVLLSLLAMYPAYLVARSLEKNYKV